MIEFSMQTDCVRPTFSLRIVCCLSKMCIVSKKKNTATDAFIEDFFGKHTKQYEECLSQIVSRRNSELFNNANNRRASLKER